MQGIESLNNFKSFVSTLGGLGRFEDTYMVHAAEGETVVPMEVLNSNPLLKERLFESMRDMGIQPERYIVGNKFNSINPVTGQPEFFLKRLKKAIADVSGYAAPVIGAMFGAPAGAAAGAAMGSFKRENPGDPNQALKMAMLGGGSGIAANLAKGRTGMELLTGKGFNADLSGILGGARNILLGDPNVKKDRGLYGSAKDLITSGFGKLTGGGGMSIEDIKTLKDEGYIDAETAGALILDIKKGGGGNNLLLKALLGIGGTLGLGSLIGEPEDITVDPSKLRTAPIETGQVFSPTQPTTVYTDYNVPIVPYQAAAEGGIIGYRKGGFTGNPHTEGPMYTGEDEGDVMPKGVQDELLRYLLNKYMQEQQQMKKRMEDKYNQYNQSPPTMLEAADGGIMDLRGGGASNGPGTGTSDSIPAMLSDGEFVMTAKAVRGAGGGDRREGARKMYEAMDRLEARG
jgi:hypothetical protein